MTVGQMLTLLHLFGERDFVERGATFVLGKYLSEANAAEALLLVVWCQGKIGQVKTLHSILTGEEGLKALEGQINYNAAHMD